MATAFKEFSQDWIEPPSPTSLWTRQASWGVLDSSDGSDGLVIKRPVPATRPGVVRADDSVLWVRRLLRTRPQLAANRDDPNHNSIEAQVEELRQYAMAENDAFSNASAAAALRFCHELAADVEPAIFLIANGNLRAVWRNEARDQIGIQFMPNGLLQYVILRDLDGRLLKALGEEVTDVHVTQTVEVHQLMGLWFLGKG